MVSFVLNEQLYLKMLAERNTQGTFRLVKDISAIRNFEAESQKEIGMIPNMPFYHIMLDVYENNGKMFRYPHIRYEKRGSAGLVLIHHQNQTFLLLEKTFRVFHDRVMLEIPRGFGNLEDSSSMKTILRELDEECNLHLESGKFDYTVKKLGVTVPDSGISNNIVDLYEIDIYLHQNENIYLKNNDIGEEITGYLLIPKEEIKEYIREKITDSFTLSAVCLYWAENA